MRQGGGKIYFSWSINSICATDYELTRQESLTGPQLRFSNTLELPQSSCTDPMAPTDIKDDLTASQLTLGSTYYYCVFGGNSVLGYKSQQR